MKRFKMSLIFLLSLLGYPKAISQPNATAFADIILVNGHVWTGESQSSFVDAVAIRGNKVTQVGTSSDIRAKADGHTQIIDLQGRLVTPGFNDAHIHFLSGAMGIFEVDLTDAKTIEEVITRIGNFARENPTREWITGRGWQYTMFPGGLPTRQMLDAIVKDRPVFIKAYDGHSAWVNSNALERARINASTRFSDYGEIVRNPQGELTGALKEGAQDLVSRIIPAPTRAEKLKALRQGIKLAATLGITSIQNASGSPERLLSLVNSSISAGVV